MKYLLLLMLLPGCSTIQKIGAEASDSALVGADSVYCNGATIGGITRKMTVEEYLELRSIVCKGKWVQE